jgi:hypothetical protein
MNKTGEKTMRVSVKLFLIGAAVLLLGSLTFYFYPDAKDAHQVQAVSTAPEAAVSKPPDIREKEQTKAVPDLNAISNGQPQVAGDLKEKGTVFQKETEAAYTIDPVLMAQAELELVNNQIYEDVARDTLPTLSIQTHNPVWVLEQKSAPGEADSDDASDVGNQYPMPAPESGEFGKLQPPEGEIWLRIPADYASEHRDIMAQHADLYRTETGYSDAVTIVLWVGGRPYAKQQYE